MAAQIVGRNKKDQRVFDISMTQDEFEVELYYILNDFRGKSMRLVHF